MHTPEVHEWGQILARCNADMFVRFWDTRTIDDIRGKEIIQTNVSLWPGKIQTGNREAESATISRLQILSNGCVSILVKQVEPTRNDELMHKKMGKGEQQQGRAKLIVFR